MQHLVVVIVVAVVRVLVLIFLIAQRINRNSPGSHLRSRAINNSGDGGRRINPAKRNLTSNAMSPSASPGSTGLAK